jgi:phage/plasmid-associated DNA primase
MSIVNHSNNAVRFTASSPKNPCPVCGRTKDGDCRLTGDGRVFCHSYQNYKPGETLRGADGQEWACVGNTTDGAGWGIFKVHEPLEKRERWQKPPRPKSEKFYYYPDRNGNPLVRVKRVDRGDGTKQFYQQRWDGSQWKPKLGDLDRSLIPVYRYKDVKAAIARGEPILWVEGEKVADLLWEIGLPATTSLGGSGGFTKYGDYSQDVAGASLVICPDRDPKGIAYAEQVARYFGATQWIYAGDAAQWDNPGDGYDLADWIADLRSQGLDNAAVKARILGAIGNRRENLMSSPADVSAAAKQPDDDKKFLERAVDSLYSDGRYITLNQRDLYRWVGTHYKLVPDCQELKRIADYCRGRKFSPSVVKNILELQKLATGITTDQVNPPGYLNCTNGVLRWWWDGDKLRTELLPHNPDLIFIDPPAVEYNPDADPTSLNRLLECLEPQPREILMRTLACALDLPFVRKRQARTPRAVLLYGTGANGKDSIRTAVFRLFGGRGCTAVSLRDFQAYDGGRKFGLADLEHSRVNWPSETVPVGKLDRVESLKLVVTGDPISIERKGIQERRLTPQTVLLFNCNQPPNMTAATEAIKSRYAIIPFTKTYKANPDPAKGELLADPRFKDDPAFIDREILPALLNLLLAKLQVVAVDGIDYSPVADQIDELRRRSSHLVQFCEDVGLIEDPDGVVTVKELWERLETWYIANNYLTIEEGQRGAKKRLWEHPGNGDKCVTASHQVLQRFTELFPKVRRRVCRDQSGNKDRVITYLCGINFLADIPKVGSPGSLCNNNNGATPATEPKNSSDPSPTHRVTRESLLPSGESLLPPSSDPANARRDSLLDRVTGKSPCSETPVNTKLEDVNAVRSDPGDPALQVSTQQKTGSPPPTANGDPANARRDSLLDRVTGKSPCSETPVNTKLEDVNAVRSDPGNPDLQISAQQIDQGFRIGDWVKYLGNNQALRVQCGHSRREGLQIVALDGESAWIKSPKWIVDYKVPLADIALERRGQLNTDRTIHSNGKKPLPGHSTDSGSDGAERTAETSGGNDINPTDG